MSIDYNFLTFIVSTMGLVIAGFVGLVRWILKQISCLPKLDNKINILYCLFKSHIKKFEEPMPDESITDFREFDKFFD